MSIQRLLGLSGAIRSASSRRPRGLGRIVPLAAAAAAVLALQTASHAGSFGTSFSLWGSANEKPWWVNSSGIAVPVGGSEVNPNYVGAQSTYTINLTGMQFYGCFKGGTTAPNSSNEMAVFVTDDVTNWTGHEMGFIKTLNDNSLKGYLQGGGNYIYRVISTGDNGYHTFKTQCESGNHSAVDFYVDGVYKFTLTNPGSYYYAYNAYWVGTTHRLNSGWNSSGEQIEMYSMVTF